MNVGHRIIAVEHTRKSSTAFLLPVKKGFKEIPLLMYFSLTLKTFF